MAFIRALSWFCPLQTRSFLGRVSGQRGRAHLVIYLLCHGSTLCGARLESVCSVSAKYNVPNNSTKHKLEIALVCAKYIANMCIYIYAMYLTKVYSIYIAHVVYFTCSGLNWTSGFRAEKYYQAWAPLSIRATVSMYITLGKSGELLVHLVCSCSGEMKIFFLFLWRTARSRSITSEQIIFLHLFTSFNL